MLSSFLHNINSLLGRLFPPSFIAPVPGLTKNFASSVSHISSGLRGTGPPNQPPSQVKPGGRALGRKNIFGEAHMLEFADRGRPVVATISTDWRQHLHESGSGCSLGATFIHTKNASCLVSYRYLIFLPLNYIHRQLHSEFSTWLAMKFTRLD
jgi:hypothetical protein